MFLTNFAPSVVRASIMGIIFLISFLVKRRSDFWVNISIASLITLLYNPYILLSLSYQLSYLGTIGIVLGMKVVEEYRRRKGEIYKEETFNNKGVKREKLKEFILGKILVVKRFFIDAIVVCISAQLFVFPIILLNFNFGFFLLTFLLTSLIIIYLVYLHIVMCIHCRLLYNLKSVCQLPVSFLVSL